jgi:hypothetical protein
MRLVAPLVIDYFVFAARPGASARRAARHAARRAACRRLLYLTQAHRQLLRLRRASECLGTSRGSSRGAAPLVVDYFAYAARPGASARRAARHVARHRSSSTTPVTRLIVDYSVHRDFVLRPRWLYFSHAECGDYLSRGNTGSTSSTPHAATTSSSGRIASTIHLD